MNITECDLRVAVGPFSIGPGRLATQLLSPLPGFEVIQRLQPFLSLSTRVSSSEVFLVDDLVVIFTGYSNGQVRKVCIEVCPLCVQSESLHVAVCICLHYMRYKLFFNLCPCV